MQTCLTLFLARWSGFAVLHNPLLCLLALGLAKSLSKCFDSYTVLETRKMTNASEHVYIMGEFPQGYADERKRGVIRSRKVVPVAPT